jgi:peptide/nickel transport system substrate-binding protein
MNHSMGRHVMNSNTHVLTRRRALGLVVLGATGAVVSACAPPPQSSIRPTPAPTERGAASTPEARPQPGGSLRAAVQTDIPNVDPIFTSPSNYDALWVAFDRLIALDNNSKPQPMLAESWDASSDFKQIKFNLRKGVQFHSGREFTSDDVKYNMLFVRDPKVGSGSLVAFSNWWTLDTPDKYTIVFKSDSPRPLIWDSLEFLNIADKDVLDGPDAKTKVGGTGAFVFQEWAQGSHIQLVKNKNYWQSGKPYLESIEYKILPDAQAMVTQLEGGTLDMVLNPPLRDIARLRSDSQYQAITNPQSGRYYTVGWTTLTAPLDNKKVRQALNYALDRKRFADTVLAGFGVAESLFWLPGSPAYDETKSNYFSFDLDKAGTLLKDAGVGPFELEYLISPNFPELSDLGQIYQADLAKLDVKLTIRQVDSATFFDMINNRKYTGMYAITSARAQLQPGSMLLTGGSTNPAGNNSGFKSDVYSQLLDASTTETDPQKQKQIYSQLNDLLLDEAFNTALASASPRMLLRGDFKGIGYTRHEGFDWTGVWKAT